MCNSEGSRLNYVLKMVGKCELKGIVRFTATVLNRFLHMHLKTHTQEDEAKNKGRSSSTSSPK
jgi:hypothetical protein